jgi:LysM repeat protein
MIKFSKIIVGFSLVLNSFNAFAELRGNYWVVKSGDTLYGIARSVFPKNASLQSKLRTEIIKLNQKVFKQGAGSLYIGAELVLPEFALSQQSLITTQPVKKVPVKRISNDPLANSNEWLVKSGDTLYSIARTFYPKSNRKQYKLRRDIVDINPSVFSGGANKMEVGLFLLLPDYLLEIGKPTNGFYATPVEIEKIQVEAAEKVNVGEVISKPVQVKITSDENIKLTEAAQQVADKSEAEVSDRVTDYQSDFISSQVSLSIGYSLGGDAAVNVQGGSDVTFGSGVHLRVSYDRLRKNKQGYRFSLGYQLDKTTGGGDSAELKQMYLQSMYLYNTPASLLGVGLSYHDNIALTTDISAVVKVSDYEPAIGLVMMYEYKRLLGKHIVGALYTKLESENSVSNVTKDMSRVEVYYRWAF